MSGDVKAVLRRGEYVIPGRVRKAWVGHLLESLRWEPRDGK